MKIIITIFFITIFTNFIIAETCEEMKQRQLKSVSLSKIKVNKNYIECVSKKKRDKDYWKWRKGVTWATNDAYYLPQNTIACHTRERTIKAYNHVLGKGGHFYPKNIRSWFTCDVLPGWSIGRIIETKNKSNVVKVQFPVPLGELVRELYIVQDSIMLLADYKKTLAN